MNTSLPEPSYLIHPYAEMFDFWRLNQPFSIHGFATPETPVVHVGKEQCACVRAFVEGRKAQLGYYANRGQDDEENNAQCVFEGGVGEIVAAETIKLVARLDGDVDFNLYEVARKSWKSDLFSGQIRFAVKSRNMSKGLPTWIFQKEDEEIFSKRPDENLIVVFVNIEEKGDGFDGAVFSFNLLTSLRDKKLFRIPRNLKLKTKLAVYSHDLVRYGMVNTSLLKM